MEMKKTEVKINEPIYLGQAVLDLSKTLMFEFWYDYLKPMYGDSKRYLGNLRMRLVVKQWQSLLSLELKHTHF